MPNMTERVMINDVMYEINNPSDPVEYEIVVPILICVKCKRRNIKDTASRCPDCGSLDLIPVNPTRKRA